MYYINTNTICSVRGMQQNKYPDDNFSCKIIWYTLKLETTKTQNAFLFVEQFVKTSYH